MNVGDANGGDGAGATSTIPLFPLNVVLFPGGPLSLRIFEARYVDMIRRCMREGAYDLITKPCSVEHLHLTIRRALENQKLRETTRTLTQPARAGRA